MSGEEVNSTNSFVDIIANTTGMIIKLTLLAMLLGHQQSRQVDVQAKRLDLALARTATLRSSQAALPGQIAKAEQDLEVMRLHATATAGELSKAEATVLALRNRSRDLEAELSKLQASAAAGTTALASRQQQAEHETQRLGAAATPEQRQAMKDAPTVLNDRQAKAQDQLADLDKRLVSLRDQLKADEATISAGESRESKRLRELAEKRAALIHEIDVHRPPTERGFGGKPIFAECFRGPDQVDRVVLMAPANYTISEGVWTRKAAGTQAAAFPQADSLAVFQKPPLDEDKYLYLIVRADSFAGFRQIREIAELHGWWVDWDSIEKDAPLTLTSQAR